jgi:hypothetical protein
MAPQDPPSGGFCGRPSGPGGSSELSPKAKAMIVGAVVVTGVQKTAEGIIGDVQQ